MIISMLILIFLLLSFSQLHHQISCFKVYFRALCCISSPFLSNIMMVCIFHQDLSTDLLSHSRNRHSCSSMFQEHPLVYQELYADFLPYVKKRVLLSGRRASYACLHPTHHGSVILLWLGLVMMLHSIACKWSSMALRRHSYPVQLIFITCCSLYNWVVEAL